MPPSSDTVDLRHHGRAGHALRLHVPTGRFRTLSSDESTVGLGRPVRTLSGRRLLCALYRDEAEEWLQIGARRWPLAAVRGRARHRLGRGAWTAEFVLDVSPAVTVKYWTPWVGVFARVDPTYDGVDHDSDDFLLDVVQRLMDSA